MSKGSQFIGVRIPPEQMQQVRARIAARNKVTQAEPWDLSAYIRYCIETDIKHAVRSRHGRPLVAPPAPAAEEPQPQPVAQVPPEEPAQVPPVEWPAALAQE